MGADGNDVPSNRKAGFADGQRMDKRYQNEEEALLRGPLTWSFVERMTRLERATLTLAR